jgi:hypothetical protein
MMIHEIISAKIRLICVLFLGWLIFHFNLGNIFLLATDETRIFTDNFKNPCLSVFNPWLNSFPDFKIDHSVNHRLILRKALLAAVSYKWRSCRAYY